MFLSRFIVLSSGDKYECRKTPVPATQFAYFHYALKECSLFVTFERVAKEYASTGMYGHGTRNGRERCRLVTHAVNVNKH